MRELDRGWVRAGEGPELQCEGCGREEKMVRGVCGPVYPCIVDFSKSLGEVRAMVSLDLPRGHGV